MVDFFKRIYTEIKLLGFKDWWWFVVQLKRDEFSDKLSFSDYYPNQKALLNDRERAHQIDIKLKNTDNMAGN